MKNLEQFKRERDAALLSLDIETVNQYLIKWNGSGFAPSMTDEMKLGAIHKAITGLTTLPLDVRQKSKDWLTARGWRSHDDGDLR